MARIHFGHKIQKESIIRVYRNMRLGMVISMYIIEADSVEEFELKKEGAKGVKVKYLLHAGVGAKRIQLRLFTIEVGGYTPLECHEHEHEVYILNGRAKIYGEDKVFIANPGTAIFIGSFEKHKIENAGNEPLRFLCTKETSEIPEELKGLKR